MARNFEFKLPDIGEGVTEGEIVKWLVAPGESVTEDQPMVEVMTDKATVTITSPHSGKIQELRGKPGSVVPVHSVLVVFDLGQDQSSATSTSQSSKSTDSGPAATAVGDIKEDLPGMALMTIPAPTASPAVSSTSSQPAYFQEKPLAAPATRKLARDLGVDLRHVPPTGPHGRVTKDDVRSFNAPVSQPAQPVAAPTKVAQPPARLPVQIASSDTGSEERIPLRGLRKRIFESMSRSKHTAAHFTFVEECDVTALKELRTRLRPIAEKAGAKLTYLPFFVKATVAALKKHPILNSAFDETTQEIVVRKYYNIGIASATDAGLIVPVVHHADRKSLLDIAFEISRLSDETKAGKAKPQDLSGSTFTITSLGDRAGLFATPVLNFPEVGIMGVHRIKQKPVVKNGQIAVGDVMLLSFSFDHRIVDGHIGAAFAYELIDFIENPDRLFIEMS